jgi:hypothetical protein
VPVWTWISLGVFVVSVSAGTVAVVFSIVRFGRASRSLARTIEPLTARLEASSEALSQHSGELADDQALLRARVDGLRASWAQLQLLVGAIQELRLGLRIARLLRLFV